ncbi:hypothetical protein M422DRAFT_189755 [Sphaerobolus stellatus SS14]|uniref:Uncharacterized protein n=1 Tax=Sphaerobolus stellatus (strain SS14) TaxID=990650 RepID=A0A0C9U2S5_SPHS4|nr:hypothetical protein M422DRAFT_189755 [Sphaerobolus stellatus SS14]
MKVQGVRMRTNGTLVVNAASDNVVNLIMHHSDTWTTTLAPGFSISMKTYSVVANFAPMEFEPEAENAKRILYTENRVVLETENDVVRIWWLNGKGQTQQTKKHSTLIISVNNVKVADNLIQCNITILGLICNVQKYIPIPVQCY